MGPGNVGAACCTDLRSVARKFFSIEYCFDNNFKVLNEK